MANAVVTVLEADGTTETDVTILDVGRQAAAASKSITLATEDKAALDAAAAAFAAGTAGTPSIDVMTVQGASGMTALQVGGNVAHDAADSGNPQKIGFKAIAHGANPTAVAADDRTNWYANRHGVPWVIGGHPNVICRSNRVADSDGAQTDAALITAGAGAKIVVTQIWVKADKNNSGNVAVKIGFGTANVPTPALAGVNGLIFDEDVGAGEGHQIGNGAGIVAIGADNEDLRITCDDPAGGQLTVGYSYYTIES